MLSNFIKTAYRSMMRNFSQTLINVIGLAIGMTCALLIFLWVHNQLNYDKWQENSDRMYRLEYETWVIMPPHFTEQIKNLPEVEDITRLFPWYEPTIRHKENSFNINNFIYADSTIFNVFTFDFVYGSPKDALIKPASIVLTETTSKKYFGNKNPVGQEILIDNNIVYTVTAVIADVKNLHLEINAIAATQDLKNVYGNRDFLTERSNHFLIYVLLKPNTNKDKLLEKIRDSDFDEQFDDLENELLLRPFSEIYFERNLPHESKVKHGNYNLVLVFSAISFLILLIACINFINISTAKAKQREKEIGMRKIVGSGRKKLIFQFLGETFFLVILAHIISIVLLEYLLPIFNNVTVENISFEYFSYHFLIIISVIVFLTTILSGFYPAIYLSSLKPALMLKGKSGVKSSKAGLRKILMTIQFSISIFLIIATIVILKQLNFILNKDLGWNQDNIITFEIKGDKFHGTEDNVKNTLAFSEELLKNPNVKNVTYVNQYPGNLMSTWNWNLNGKVYPMKILMSDPELVHVLDLEIVEGRNFSYDIESDKTNKVILNEIAVDYLGLDNPIGAIVDESGLEVIGVVKNFNFNSLHSKIVPLGIRWYGGLINICIKVPGENIPAALDHIESTFKDFSPTYPFEYSFLDESFARQYEKEVKLSRILLFFAFIAILIATIGLFGMSTFMSISRTKEIGIRKALGSSISGILFLFTAEFIRWVLIAFIIASPIAYYLLNKWLAQYPYKTDISWWVFVVALLITLFIALITIGYHVIKSSKTNPADCLRYE
ncbi:MAG: hypothetical protein C0597_03395 [Marinilabiliales bacterium]|nr:MAG: hypothetical protein C0597_03395 [Marinilabiliales bacterium]